MDIRIFSRAHVKGLKTYAELDRYLAMLKEVKSPLPLNPVEMKKLKSFAIDHRWTITENNAQSDAAEDRAFDAELERINNKMIASRIIRNAATTINVRDINYKDLINAVGEARLLLAKLSIEKESRLNARAREDAQVVYDDEQAEINSFDAHVKDVIERKGA